MNTPQRKGTGELLSQALAALEEGAGIIGRVERTDIRRGPGSIVALQHRDQVVRFAAQVKEAMRPSHIDLVQEQLRSLKDPYPPLLVTRHVSAPLARKLRDREISFLDSAGNAHLNAGGWFVLITGNPAPPERAAPNLGAATWQVAYALLQDPRASRLPMRELALRSGVSLGAASLAVRALHERGWVRSFGRRGHSVSDVEGLLQAWELGYLDRLAGKLRVTWAQAPGASSLLYWAECVQDYLGPEVALLGGELAAERMGLDIHGPTAAVHVARWDAETMRGLRLVPAKKGPIAILRTFGTANANPQEPRLVDPLLVRAELATLQDERLLPARAELRALILARWERG